ncbi:branched-chain amino acid transport system ATP-binding protein [Azospirillum agricola]|uniref:ABC transporter ATP-binding protein n=1 Tax=Azospirillum agricola TaxID=1720247 RepID=UPI001F2EEAC4|nr:ABC transporter ATP-binding protein [Azospirillum agricola]MBP2227705.1 branched-chain amino acid transport system ATP-binding protein [Azospirillum agricola]
MLKPPMLQVEKLQVSYGHREAVHDVSLSVEAGEIVTLVGSNGAGKTTTLKAISGLLRASGGSISFEGERIDRLAPHQIIERGLVHVPEGRLLFPEMTVLEHLELGALRGRPGEMGFPERLRWVYDLFPVLAERHAQKAGTMSGGQQQMVAIARGLMANPKCLMLDEPSLGLAPIMVDTLADTIRNLHGAGITVLLVEQRVDLALRLADRAYVLETGRVVMEEAAHTLLADPRIKTAYLGL